MYLFISMKNIVVTAILAAFWNTWFFLAVFEWAAPAAAPTILSTIFRYFGPGWLAESGRPIWNPTLPIFYDFFPRNAQRYRFLDSLGTVVYSSSTTRAAVAASKRRRRRREHTGHNWIRHICWAFSYRCSNKQAVTYLFYTYRVLSKVTHTVTIFLKTRNLGFFAPKIW